MYGYFGKGEETDADRTVIGAAPKEEKNNDKLDFWLEEKDESLSCTEILSLFMSDIEAGMIYFDGRALSQTPSDITAMISVILNETDPYFQLPAIAALAQYLSHAPEGALEYSYADVYACALAAEEEMAIIDEAGVDMEYTLPEEEMTKEEYAEYLASLEEETLPEDEPDLLPDYEDDEEIIVDDSSDTTTEEPTWWENFLSGVGEYETWYEDPRNQVAVGLGAVALVGIGYWVMKD